MYDYIEPLLKTMKEYKINWKNWKLFKERQTVMKRQVKNGEKNEDELKQFIKPLQEEMNLLKLDVDILQLHALINTRNGLTHYPNRSVDEQTDFLDHIREYEFTDKFIYCDLAKTMLSHVKQAKLTRYVN
jgi:hypothetical protein